MTTSRALRKYNALLLDSDASSRNRLKSVCGSVVNFGKIITSGTIQNALKELSTPDTRTDVIFISHHIDHEATVQFIKDCKSSEEGEDATYIMVLPTSEGAKTQMANAMMIGADGVLFEPYSVDVLIQITELSDKIRRERSQSREESAIQLLLKDIIKQVDALAFLKASGNDVGPVIKHFRASCATLKTLEPAVQELYYQLAIDAFENAPVMSVFMKTIRYEGVSQRVRKKLADIVKSRVESEFIAE
jgi:hypothetical protein